MSSFYFRFSLLSLCVAGLVRGHETAGQPPGANAPEPPVKLEHFVVTASPFKRDQAELMQATTALVGSALDLKRQLTLGDTLAAEPGMSATSFGPGASRPLIRGLGGDRIRLLENGVGTGDASSASPDHAVSVEPFLAERIEVVRGPASLLYGSAAVGGVVNVITHRIESQLPERRVAGELELGYDGASDGWSRGGFADMALLRGADQALVLHLDGARREAGELRIPGFAESDRRRAGHAAEAIAAGEPAPTWGRDRLPNSALRADSAAAGLSWITREGFFGASYSGFDTLYGIPTEERTRVDLRQRRLDVQGELRRELGVFSGARVKFGQGDYRHRELEPDGAVGTEFRNHSYEARGELLHGSAGHASGVLGAQATRSDAAVAGAEAFMPPTLVRGAAVFAFEEVPAGATTWQYGARWERQRVAPKTGLAARVDATWSGALGLVRKFGGDYTAAFSLTRTERAPNALELFANGPHAGTHAFEVGDPALGRERSLGAELSLRRRTGLVTGELTLFANRFSGYIYEQPSGVTEPESGLEIFRTEQRDARFYGAELETLWHLHSGARHRLDLRLAGDFTRARETAGALPRIPPARTTAGLDWAVGAWSAGVEWQHAFAQRRIAVHETPTAGYELVGAHATYRFTLGGLASEAFVRASNLLDREIRQHASFLKDEAPLAGRAVALGLRTRF
ncbi:MAG: TonB-dependent receptor [Opitutae bacterium]|nr:TonB-dependent receptor [Opitutae bacterium]